MDTQSALPIVGDNLVAKPCRFCYEHNRCRWSPSFACSMEDPSPPQIPGSMRKRLREAYPDVYAQLEYE